MVTDDPYLRADEDGRPSPTTESSTDEIPGLPHRSRKTEIVTTVIGLTLFVVALVILFRTLRAHSYHQIADQVRGIPREGILLALLFTAGSYFTLTLYDRLGLRHLGRSLAYRKSAFTTFTTYSVSHSMGFALFTGGSVRYRLYTAWGLSVGEIAQLIGFGVLTFWLGYATTAFGVFLLSPLAVPPELHLPFRSTVGFGIVAGLALAAYFVFNVTHRHPFVVRGQSVRLPSPGITLLQMAAGLSDWLFSSAALWILLPAAPGVSFHEIVGIFLIAQIAGVSSNIPGGLGIFESVVVLLLGAKLEPSVILGTLLVFRVVYYLFPLGIAAVLLGGYEIALRRRAFTRAVSLAGQWTQVIAPYFFSATVFLGGVVLLFSGATPAVKGRLAWLHDLLPLPVIEISHFLGSLIGVALLLLARGLQRRLDVAWVATAFLLVFGIVFSLAKGGDYEEAFVLFIMLMFLLPSRTIFYRKSSLMREAFTFQWIVAISIVVLSALWLTVFSYKHIEFSSDLWWQFDLNADAPRAYRAATGIVALIAVVAVSRLLRAYTPESELPTPKEIAEVRQVISRSLYTYAHLALMGDKLFMTSPSKDAFIMYSVAGRSWIAMGDPVGPLPVVRELVWQYHEMVDQHGGWTVFYQVRPELLPLYLEVGLTLLKLGEEARVPISNFSLSGHANKAIRHWHRKPASEGCRFRVISPAEVLPLIPELEVISHAWLKTKHTREKRFSLGYFDPAYLTQTPMALVERDNRIVGFANLWLGGLGEELSIDLMRYSPQAPPGVIDFLLIELMQWGNDQGYRWFNLGMAPMSGFENRRSAPFWNQLAGAIYRRGSHFYNFQGLRQYKEKFHPVWEPRYLACPGGVAQYRIFAHVSAIIGGGLKGVLTR